MSIAAVKIKIMPSSPETNLKEIEDKIKHLLSKNKVQNPHFEIQPVAFGLKAIIVMFGWPEEGELDTLEADLSKIDDISSVQVLDIRRAIG